MRWWEKSIRAYTHYNQLGSSWEQSQVVSGGKGARGRTRVAGGIMANMERGPIKSKAKGSMNNLAVKHTWGDTSSMYVKAKML